MTFAAMLSVGANAAERLPPGTYLTKAEVCAQDDFGSGKKDNLGPEDFLVVGKDGSISFYETLCKPKRGKASAFICDSGGAYSNDGATMKVDVVREDGKVKAVKIEKALYYYCGGRVLKQLI